MKTIAEMMRMRPVKGDVGVEIEVEGDGLPHTEKYWSMERDGSLRGESMEYVLSKPMSLADCNKALQYLDECYKNNGTVVHDTVRAGVHVHVNVQRLTFPQLFNFITTFLILEEVLVKFCGETREGNLFCLRSGDASYLIDAIVDVARSKNLLSFRSDNLRYAALNVKAIATYGSLEFRSMRGTRDLDLIYKWAALLVGLRDFSSQFENPQQIIEAFSINGPEAFYKAALEEFEELLGDGAGYANQLKDGMRRAQEIAFCRDWSEFKEWPTVVIGGVKFPDNGVWFDEPEEDM